MQYVGWDAQMGHTMILVIRQKTRKVMCALRPQRALIISSTVCAVGALRLISIAKMPNITTWMVAPAAYLHLKIAHMLVSLNGYRGLEL